MDSITDRDAFFASYSGRCYLLHFVTPYRHARHYLGSSDDLAKRLAQHRNGTGARLMEVVHDAGISFVVARTWVGGKNLERQLKAQKHGPRLCPICRNEVSLEQVLAEQPRPAPRTSGRRRPMVERSIEFHRGGGA